MHDTEKNIERLLLFTAEDAPEENLRELAMLAETAGAEVLGQLVQKREKPHPGHYLGKGKVEELKALIAETGATGVLCDDELSAAQIKNLDEKLDLTILDRTMVILDIFAQHALSAEGKAQVELAQLKYRLSRLSGLGKQLSRQGGGTGGAGAIGGGQGIGAKGPGEKMLETDRRHIKSRIGQLNAELREIRTLRAVQRERRLQTRIPVMALVGYTNAGKSTLMNALTDANVLEENKLFATLETTTRKLTLPGGTEALLTDTVGFINKLPHHLVQAFRATLEELEYATLLIHVVDASNPARDNQIKVVRETLSGLKCLDKPMITAFNKIDQLPHALLADTAETVAISAKTSQNIQSLLGACEAVLQSMRQKITLLIPYTEGKWVSLIHNSCEVVAESHEEQGTKIEAYAPADLCSRLAPFLA